jgi:prophage regulatory protein
MAEHKQLKIIDSKEVTEIIPLSERTMMRRAAKGTFPKPIDLGGGRKGWVLSEIEAWIEKQRTGGV